MYCCYFFIFSTSFNRDISELMRKYAGVVKQHSLMCKRCGTSRSPIYCRMCTFFGPNFPDIIPVHTDVSKHPGCEEQHHDDIVNWA